MCEVNDMDSELLGGVLYAKPTPLINHARVCKNIAGIFGDGSKCSEKLQLDEQNAPIPDVAVGELNLIAEIVSAATLRNDRYYKKDLYARHGVKEYWIVDDEKLSVEAYRLLDGEYVLHDVFVMLSLHQDTQFKTPLLEKDGLTIDLKDVFKDVYENVLERS